jgi:hypothetical protein
MAGFIVSWKYVNNLVYYEVDIRSKIYKTVLESIKNGLINEILLNINLCGKYVSKKLYSSNEYINKIKSSNYISIMEIVKNHFRIRKEFLGSIGTMYENIGYKINLLPIISKL